MPIVSCKICATNFYVKPSHQHLGWGKYCSTGCRSQSQLLGKQVYCKTCGQEVYRSPARLKHSKSGEFFCSKTCQTRWRNNHFSGKKHPNWNGGENVYRKTLIESGRKRVCVLCGQSDIRILSAHHLDHDRKNNALANLVWLCLNCHYLVHHDKNAENTLKN